MRLEVLEAAGEGTKMADHFSPIFRPRLSLFSDHLRTVLAVKGSLRRAQQRRALDGSGPFRTTHSEKRERLTPNCSPGRGPLRRHFGTLFRRHRQNSQGHAAALPWFKRATGIDPEFAAAYAWLGRMY